MDSGPSNSNWGTENAANEPTGTEANQSNGPQFGLLDVVEAFTALRHEFRGQTTQNREMTASCKTAVEQIQQLEAKLQATLTSSVSSDAKRLALLLTETDDQLTRAIDAMVTTALAAEQHDTTTTLDGVDAAFTSLNLFQRWIARPFYQQVRNSLANRPKSPGSAMQGLQIVLTKLRTAMQEIGIERTDTVGKQFDPESMNAIGSVKSLEYSPGQVAEQLVAAYRWHGELIRTAEVRVVQEPHDTKAP